MVRARARAGSPVPAVRVDVLGPLRLTVGDEVVEVPGPKRRALLAVLVMAEGRAVPVEDLLDALWPADLPDAARASLHSHVSRLRSHLGQAAGCLEGLSGAYRLRLDHSGSGTDVARVRSLLAAATAATPTDARHLLEKACSLWRGAPLSEFADVPRLAAWRVSLDELRRRVEEARAAAALPAGAPSEAVELAAALVAADPLSESAVVLLMRALDASGRAVEALRAGYDYRRRLGTQTGLEPSPALGDMEQHIAARTSPRPGRPARPATRLRGRHSELAALHRLLAHERLVTVLGPGGVGKTRLAAEAAARVEQATALLLGSVTDPASIPQALAAALDLRIVQGAVLPACAALLGASPQLLLIDNCEHLLAAVRDLVAMLLDTCPQLTVLATSREPLGLAAEQRLRVAPLPVTSARDSHDLPASPAVAVFVDRARGVRPDFSPGTEDLRLIAEIVRRLDGVPLAIELAAGRLSSLDLADLHSRLDRSLDLLGDSRGMTLRRTIEWSYDLLAQDERRLFRHLGVFPDGFDLASAETVAAELRLGGDAAGVLARLVDASMVEAALGPAPRYRMLDTIRSFALDRLESEGEHRGAMEGFLRWALDLVAWIDRTIDTDDEHAADRLLRREVGNLRAAWRLARAQGRLDDSVRIVVGLAEVAGWRDVTEVWTWGLELADDPSGEVHPVAVEVLGTAAASAWSRGELDRADRLARKGLRLEGSGVWRCHAALALVALSRGELRDAVAYGTRAAAGAPRADQSLGVAALAAAYQGALDEARLLNERLAAVARSPTLEGFRRYVAGEIDALAGRNRRAEDHYEDAIRLARDTGACFLEGIASVGLVALHARQGRVVEALDGYRDLIDYWKRTGGWVQQWTTLRNLVGFLRSLGDEEDALFLDAAADGAPDAPATIDGGGYSERYRLSPARIAGIRSDAAAATRAGVLDVARQAIEHHRAATPKSL